MSTYFSISVKYSLIQWASILLLVLYLPVAKSHGVQNQSLGEICQISPADCLAKVNVELKSAKAKSRLWFSLMQFKLTSLFILQHTDELYEETKRWIHDEDLPVPFQVTLYMYYAKSCIYYGDKEEGKKYIYKAKEQLAVMNGAYPSPIKLIEIANLQMYIGEFSEAYSSLNTLKIKYRNSQNPHFMMELHAHLGHLARNLGYFDEALAHWHATVPWSYKYGNEQQIATVLFNLAQAQDHKKQYALAEKNYLKTVIHAEKAKDVIKASHARLYLAKIKLIAGDKKQAKALFLMLNEQKLEQPHLDKYRELKKQL
jgi:tetratricopeptide (TPR) repeat protein